MKDLKVLKLFSGTIPAGTKTGFFIISTKDTTVKGGVVTAENTLDLDVGGNLTVESLQDKNSSKKEKEGRFIQAESDRQGGLGVASHIMADGFITFCYPSA